MACHQDITGTNAGLFSTGSFEMNYKKKKLIQNEKQTNMQTHLKMSSSNCSLRIFPRNCKPGCHSAAAVAKQRINLLGECDCNLKLVIFKLIWVFPVKLPLHDGKKTSLMIIQH